MATTQRDDDYLICREYQERINEKSTEYPDFITFNHPNGNHYFAWVHDGEVVLRSEAYPDAEKMERGIKAILKNWDLPQRYSVETNHGVHFLVLWGGGDHQSHTGNMESHNEIGRSCPKKSKEELHNLLHGKGEAFAQSVVPITHTPSEVSSVSSTETVKTVETIAPVAAVTAASEVIKKPEPIVETERAASYTAPTTRHTTTTTTTVTESESNGGGFKWWYLLPLLLLIPLFLKMCGSKKEVPQASATMTQDTLSTAVTPAATDTTAAPATSAKPEPAKAATPDCDLNWILFDFDKYDIRSDAQVELKTMADILKANPDYVGDLNAYTDAKGSNQYNDQLSKNRANAAKKALIALGIDGGRLYTSASSENNPIATNTDDDTGRKYNRRVELRVKDKAGKEICKSIPPAVPQGLKQ